MKSTFRNSVATRLSLLSLPILTCMLSGQPLHSPFSIPATSVHELKNGDDAYRIFIYRPERTAPPQGYPVVYLLDGNAIFGTAVEAIRFSPRLEPAVIVGIGYPVDTPLDIPRRFFDLTSKDDAWEAREKARAIRTGGQDRFLEFIEGSVMPLVRSQAEIDAHRQMVFGHSLGGLFVLHALFSKPGLFQAYVAASPSIWWANEAILQEEKGFPEKVSRLTSKTSLLVTIGAYEQGLTRVESGLPKQQTAGRLKAMQARRMVDNARTLGERLGSLHRPMFTASYLEFPEENHGSVVPAVISRALWLFLETVPRGEF